MGRTGTARADHLRGSRCRGSGGAVGANCRHELHWGGTRPRAGQHRTLFRRSQDMGGRPPASPRRLKRSRRQMAIILDADVIIRARKARSICAAGSRSTRRNKSKSASLRAHPRTEPGGALSGIADAPAQTGFFRFLNYFSASYPCCFFHFASGSGSGMPSALKTVSAWRCQDSAS